jgi:PAS domain S-box-containing protein
LGTPGARVSPPSLYVAIRDALGHHAALSERESACEEVTSSVTPIDLSHSLGGNEEVIRATDQQVEDKLRESEERFRLAMHNVASGVYILDLNGLVTYVNPAAEKMLGWTNAELLGRKMHNVTHYKHADGSPFPASECPGLQVQQTGVELHEVEDTFIRRDGSFLPVVHSASLMKTEGRTVGLVVVLRDDTLRREAESARRQSEERFRLMTDSASVMVWMSGPDGLSTYSNRRSLEFTGRPIEAELGNGWAEGVHPDDITRCMETYTQAFDRRLPFKMEIRLRRHDGDYRWVLSSGVPTFNPDGSFAGYIGSAVDITDQKLAAEVLSNLSRNLMEAQEKERAWIARELHDDFAQRVVGLALQLHNCRRLCRTGRASASVSCRPAIRRPPSRGTSKPSRTVCTPPNWSIWVLHRGRRVFVRKYPNSTAWRSTSVITASRRISRRTLRSVCFACCRKP